MNVLLSCVGRRSYMVDYFRKAIGPDGKVICTNSHMDATGMLVADKAYESPPVHDASYIPSLLKIAKDENVSLVVSLFDIDLPFLAAAKEQFANEGITVAVSSPEVIDIVNDKWRTFNFLREKGFHTPATFRSLEDAQTALKENQIDYPLFIKPRWGMGSIAIFKANNEEELFFFYNYALNQVKESYLHILSHQDFEQSILIQEFINGQEYGLDVLNDFDGNHVVTVVKKKLAMRSGETDAAVSVSDPVLKALGTNLAEVLKHIGNLDVDILYKNETPYVLELNARFGGGYPFSHLAGVDFPKVYVDWVSEKPANNEDIVALPDVKGFKSLNVIQG